MHTHDDVSDADLALDLRGKAGSGEDVEQQAVLTLSGVDFDRWHTPKMGGPEC